MLSINRTQLELLQKYAKTDTDALSYLKELDDLNLGTISKAKGMLANAASSARSALHNATAPAQTT
jgi:hypothetical protein